MNQGALFAWRLVGWFLIAALAVYAADYGYLRLRMSRRSGSQPIESMTRTRVLAIPQKNGKFDYESNRSRRSPASIRYFGTMTIRRAGI